MAGNTGQIVTIDPSTGDEQQRSTRLGAPVLWLDYSVPAGVQFIGDSHDVTIASYDGKIYRWETDLGRATDFACQMAGRNLTVEE